MTIRVGYLPDHSKLYSFISSISASKPCKIICANSYLASEIGQSIGCMMSQSEDGSHLNSGSVALARWFEAHWAQQGNGRTLISSEQREILLSEVIEEHKGSLLFEQPSTVELLRRILQWGTKGYSGSDAVANQLNPVIQQYWQLVDKRGFIESGQACKYLEKSKYIHDETLVFWSIDDLQIPLARLIGALADRGYSIWFLYGDTQSPHMRGYQLEFVSSVGSVDEVVTLDETSDRPPTTALAFLQKGIYEQSAERVKQDDSIAFLGADSPMAERFAVIRKVCELVKTGHSPEGIAVLYRAIAPEAEYLVGELMAEGIEVALDLSVAIKSTRLGHAFMTLLAAVLERQGESVPVSAYVLSAYSPYGYDEAIEIDRYLRRKRLRGRGALKHLRSRGLRQAEGIFTADEAVDKTMKYARRANAAEWASVVDMLLHRSIKEGNSPYHKDLDAAAHKAIIGILSQLELVEERVSAASLLGALTSAQVHITPRPGDPGVLVADMNRVRGRVFDTVILAGLSANTFHRKVDYSAQDLVAAKYGVTPLLHDIQSARSVAVPLNQEMYFHCQLLHIASRRIVFAAQHITLAGDKMLPSSFLEEVVSHIDIREDLKEQDSDKDKLQILCEASSMTMTSSELLGDESYGTATREASDMRVVDDVARIDDLLSGELILSPSQVESILFCPFYWLLSRVIGGEELDGEIGNRENGTVAHFILQQVVESWIETSSEPIRTTDIPKLMNMVDTVVNNILEKSESYVSDGEYSDQIRMAGEVYENSPLVFAGLISGIKMLLQNEPKFGKQTGQNMRPVATELSLGFDSDLTLQGVRMRGAIDRVNSDGQSAVIVDYKGNSETYGVKGDTQINKGYIQNALYMRMLQRAIDDGEVESLDSQIVAGAYYRGYSNDKTNVGIYPKASKSIEDEEQNQKAHEELLERVDNLLTEAINRAQEGLVATAGADTRKCLYCPHIFCEYRGEQYA